MLQPPVLSTKETDFVGTQMAPPQPEPMTLSGFGVLDCKPLAAVFPNKAIGPELFLNVTVPS